MKKLNISYSVIAIMVVVAVIIYSNIPFNYTFVVGNERSEGSIDLFIESGNNLFLPIENVTAQLWSTYDGFFDNSARATYLIIWIDENQTKFHATADFKQLIPRNFDGCIYFTIDDQNNLIYSASYDYRGENIFKKKVKGIKETVEVIPQKIHHKLKV